MAANTSSTASVERWFPRLASLLVIGFTVLVTLLGAPLQPRLHPGMSALTH